MAVSGMRESYRAETIKFIFTGHFTGQELFFGYVLLDFIVFHNFQAQYTLIFNTYIDVATLF